MHPNEEAKTISRNFSFSRRYLRKARVRVVNDYADVGVVVENFEGFSQILKEQSGKKSFLGAFTHPIAII